MKKLFVVLRISASARSDPSVAISLVDKTGFSPAEHVKGSTTSIERILAHERWRRGITEYSGHIEMDYTGFLESGINVGDTVEVEVRKEIEGGLEGMTETPSVARASSGPSGETK